MLDVLEQACGGKPVRVCVSTPPQHGKSLGVEHAIARDLLRHPGTFWAYITYSMEKALGESLHIRDLALRADVELRGGATALSHWRTPQGGGLLATGIGGPITGQRNLKRIVVDDPIKGMEEAESALIRNKTYDWFQSSVITRVHPDTSIVVIATRWHHDDLIGRLSKLRRPNGDAVWLVINLPAIDDYGAPLWPEGRPLAFLESLKSELTSYVWSALYMGRPIPRGEAVFGPPTYFNALPAGPYREAGGIDLAYTEKTRSDWSVALVMLLFLGATPELDTYYIVDVRRAQRPPPEFHEEAIEPLEETYPGIRFRCYLATSEMGSGQFMRKLGTNINIMRARVDKFQRALPFAAAWNSGRVFIPRHAPWLEAFKAELEIFTGKSDKHDDQVDAGASAFDELQRKRKRIGPAAPLQLSVPLDQMSVG